jgi:hypothetical protein
MHYAVELEGLPPGLVMNARLPDSNKVPSAEEEAEGHSYRLPSNGKKKGELYMPGDWLRAAILRVSSSPSFKIRIGGKKVSPKALLAAGLLVDDKLPLGTNDYEIYIRPAKIGDKQILRSRPRILPWSVTTSLKFSEANELFQTVGEALQPVMADMLKLALSMYGVGDNRPGSPKKPGPHGTAKVIKCELAK